ncbi:AAA family ATPase [Streptosporangium lutulentum]
MLYGRGAEQAVIDRLLSDSRAGHSGALLVRGEPGIGKTALLNYAATAAGDLRVIRGTGVESEAELPFAGLHLLLRPVLDQVGALPEHQERRCAPPSDSPPWRRATACWSAWRCSPCCRNWPRTARCWCWWTTPSGWTAPRSTRCCSPRGGWTPRGSH